MLKKMDSKHALQADGPAASSFGVGVEGLGDGAKFLPGNNPIHFLKKDFPARGFAMAFKAAFGKAGLAHACLSEQIDMMFDIMPEMVN